MCPLLVYELQLQMWNNNLPFLSQAPRRKHHLEQKAKLLAWAKAACSEKHCSKKGMKQLDSEKINLNHMKSWTAFLLNYETSNQIYGKLKSGFDLQKLNVYLLTGLLSISVPYPIRYASLKNCRNHQYISVVVKQYDKCHPLTI